MNDEISNVLEALVDMENGIEGIEVAYSYSPESIVVMPAIVNYPLRGTDTREEASTIRSLYVFGAELHVCRGILRSAEELVRPFPIRFSNALWADPTIGGTVDTVLYLRHAFTPIKYAGEWHMGVRFEFGVKMRRACAI